MTMFIRSKNVTKTDTSYSYHALQMITFSFLLDYVAELFETLTKTPREELDSIREELIELEPEEKEKQKKQKYNLRKARKTVMSSHLLWYYERSCCF